MLLFLRMPGRLPWPKGMNMLMLLFTFFWPFALLQGGLADENLTTVIVCEGGLASLHCPPQHEIVVHLANFGRFALHTCNPTKRTDINTQCHNPHSIDVLRARCEHRQRCVVPVNWAIFPPAGVGGGVGGVDQCPGTPNCDHRQHCVVRATTEVFEDSTCPDTLKYLEASYGCARTEATTTTSTTTLSTSAAMSSTSSTLASLPAAASGNLPFDGGGGEENGQSHPPGCQARLVRNMHWPRTAPGQPHRMPCPEGSRGHTDWQCSPQGQWHPLDGPNLAKCISDWARELKEDLDELGMGLESSGEQRRNWLELLREGHAQVRKEALLGGDARVLAEVLAEIVEKLARRKAAEASSNGGIYLLGEELGEERRAKGQEALDFVRLIIDSLGHMLRPSQRAAWLDLSPEQRQALATQLLAIVPQTLALLLPLPNWPKAGSESLLAEPTLVAEIAQASIYDYVPFPSMSLYRQNFDTVLLPREALQLYGQDLANVFYTAWDPALGNYLLGKQSSGPEVGGGSVERIISRVVGISLVPLNGKMMPALQIRPRGRPMLVTFQNADYLVGAGRISEARCVWWSSDLQKFVENSAEDGEGDDEDNTDPDSMEGCHLREQNRTHFVCQCSSVNAHYAVMARMELGGAGEGSSGPWHFNGEECSLLSSVFLTSLLLSLCCLGLALAIVLLMLRPERRRTKGEQIKVAFGGRMAAPQAGGHICLLLLLLQAVLLAQVALGQEHNQDATLCKLLALGRHFLLLAILCWALLDAFHLCQCSRRFSTPPAGHQKADSSCCSACSLLKTLGSVLFGYGFPLLILAIISLVWPSNAGKNAIQKCWPIVDDGFTPFPLIVPICLLLLGTICCLLISFGTLRAGKNLKNLKKNSPAVSNNGNKFFTAGYQPCATTGSGTSSSSSASSSSSQQCREERQALAQLGARLNWLCARLALFAIGICSAVYWTMASNGGENGIFRLIAGLTVATANAGIGILMLAEMIGQKKAQNSYHRWRTGKPATSAFLKPLDWLFCYSPPAKAVKKTLARNSRGEIARLKLAGHSSPNNAVGGHSTPNSSSASSGGGCHQNVGTGNGAMSACSDQLSTTAELHLLSSSDASQNSENGNGNGTSGSGFSNYPPPPAPLLQLYQEHKRKSCCAASASSPSPHPSFRACQNVYGEDGSGDGAIYEYATIPYEELLTAYHQQQQRRHQQQSPLAIGRQMPISARGTLYGPMRAHSPSMALYSPRLLHSANVNNQPIMPMPFNGPCSYAPGGGPFPVRLGMLGAQQQVSHQPVGGIFQEGGESTQLPLHHYGAFQMAAEQPPPILEMGLHSAPPNFPPPPPPAPSAADPMADPFPHFRRSSSSSLRSGVGSTLVLRMDLSRQQPLISERIDSLDDMVEEG